jgi:signal transduction histidine kinase
MKKLIVFVLIIFTAANLHAQNRRTDSLKLLLANEKTDTGKVAILIRLGFFGFGSAKNDSALWYLQQALQLAQETKYVKGELTAVLRIASYYQRTGNYPEALKMSLGNLAMARKYHEMYILFLQTRLTSWIYRGLGDFEKGLEFAKQLAPLADSISEGSRRGSALQIANNIISGAYLDMGMPDSAFFYKRLVYQFGVEHNDLEWMTLGAHGLGESYAKKGNVDSAFYYYKTSIRIGMKIRRFDMVSRSTTNMAVMFYKKGEIDSAFSYIRKSQKTLQLTDDPGGFLIADSLLATLFQSRGQYDSAYKYLKSYVTLNDSLNNQNKMAQALDFSFNETLQQQQLEQSKREIQQQYQNRIKLYSLVGIVLVFLLIAFLLYRNNRNKQKANALLSKQKDEIQSTLSELKSTQKQLIQSEKMASLGELTAGIAHEIQNPLNFINNFSDVNKELLEELKAERLKPNAERDEPNEDEIINDVIANEEKINHHGKRADAIVKGMLQHSRTSTGVKEPTDINALTDEYLRLSYHGMRAKDKSFNADMKTDFDNSIGKINIIPQDIGRVLLNLFNNAFYTCTERSRASTSSAGQTYEPTVSVTTKKLENRVCITVSDNGNGIPQKIVDKIFQPFFTTKPTGQGTGLGLSLSYDIVKAQGGEIKVESKEGEGTEFIIQLLIS